MANFICFSFSPEAVNPNYPPFLFSNSFHPLRGTISNCQHRSPQKALALPVISRFFGIIIRMYYDEHNPPHFHAEYQGEKAVFDMAGALIKGNMRSKTALRLVKEWAELHGKEIEDNWNLALNDQELKKIDPLD